MVLTLNKSDRDISIVYMGVEYRLPAGKAVEIPEEAAKLYFAYGIEEITEDIANLCIARIKRYNESLAGLPDRDVWDNYVQEVKLGLDVVKDLEKKVEAKKNISIEVTK